MKCSIKSLLALMVGAVILESCNDSDYFETTKSGAAKTGNMSFTATVDGAESRASFTEDSLSFMKPNNEISVFSFGQNNKFTMNDEGIFIGNCEDNDEYYAVSPYSEKHRTLFDGNLYEFVIDWNGKEQTLDLNKNYAPMVAHVVNAGVDTQNVPLAFQNVCALIKFTTDYKCKSITVKSRGGENLVAKTLYVKYDENGKPHIYNCANLSQTITLTGKDGGNIEAGTYYIPVMPGNLSAGVDITFTNIYKEKTCTKTFTNNGALVCGEFVDLGTINIKSEMVDLAGKGTEADPYLIHDFDQLMEMRDFVNNSTGGADCYKLADDIDGGGAKIQPIGTFKKPFFGKFDGNNKTIKNITLGNYECRFPKMKFVPFTYVTALFGHVRNATFKDLTIDDMTLLPVDDTDNQLVKSPFIGICYGSNDSRTTISNVTITANQNVSMEFINRGYFYGGIIGASAGNLCIDKCTNYSCVDGKIVCKDYGLFNVEVSLSVFGGILGLAIGGMEGDYDTDYDANVEIARCRNFGNFNLALPEYVDVKAGGILGAAYDSAFSDDIAVSIFSCVNYGTIRTNGTGSVKPKSKEKGVKRSECVGGIVGLMSSDGYRSHDPLIANCVNNGELHTFYPAGGIIGVPYDDSDIHINYCASYGLIETKNPLSSIVGEAQNKVSIGVYYDNRQGATAEQCVDFMNRFQQTDRKHYCKWRVSGDKPDLDFTEIRGPIIPQK